MHKIKTQTIVDNLCIKLMGYLTYYISP